MEECRVAQRSGIHSLLLCHYWREMPNTMEGRRGVERGKGQTIVGEVG